MPASSLTAPSARLVSDHRGWKAILPRLRKASVLAVDMESNGFHRYRESVCLIQLAVSDSVWILDPFQLAPLEELGEIFSNPDVIKIFHSADYDIRSFDRDYGFRVRGLFDTSIAAAFLGLRTLGLDRALQEHLGVSIVKEKSLQKSDWTQRPLSAEALNYAASDVLYLIPLHSVLTRKLEEAGRLEWVREECERLEAVRFVPPPPPEESVLEAKGFRKLTPRQRAVFRALYLFREREARKHDRPPFKVISNDALLALAENPQQDLRTLKGFPSRPSPAFLESIRQALEKGVSDEPVHLAKVKSIPRPEAERIRSNMALLKSWREAAAAPLGLDPPLIWPTRHLEFLAQTCPDALDPALNGTGPSPVRRWQEREFGESLGHLLPQLKKREA